MHRSGFISYLVPERGENKSWQPVASAVRLQVVVLVFACELQLKHNFAMTLLEPPDATSCVGRMSSEPATDNHPAAAATITAKEK